LRRNKAGHDVWRGGNRRRRLAKGNKWPLALSGKIAGKTWGKNEGSNSSHGGGMAFAFMQGSMRRGEAMNEQEFQNKLAELMGEISTLPQTERQKLQQLAEETRARHERLRQTVSSLQESLDYLRLSIKYLVFDLEATKRENGYLRKMLEETTGGND
jgi:hypothetical protein